MRRAQPIKVFSELRDLELFDSEDELCGIVDEVEFEGEPGRPLRIGALLVGPGAYGSRLPAWLNGLIRHVAGDAVVRIPWSAVEHVTSRVTLNRPARELGLGAVEGRLQPLLRKVPTP